jgi:hypothetical protein
MRYISAIPKATVQNYQPLFPCMFLRPHPQLSSVSIQYSNIIFMHIYFYQYSFRHTSLKDYNHHSLSKQKLWLSDKNLDQEVCSLCDLRFEPCGCSYDGNWRLIWSLTSGPVELVEMRAS